MQREAEDISQAVSCSRCGQYHNLKAGHQFSKLSPSKKVSQEGEEDVSKLQHLDIKMLSWSLIKDVNHRVSNVLKHLEVPEFNIQEI